MLRVDGDSTENYEDVKDAIWADDSNWKSTSTLINSAASAEILVRMNPPLQGLYSGADHDLELIFDEDHFTKFQQTLDSLRVGSDIRFTGYLRDIGILAGHRMETNHDGKKMPTFKVFDLQVIQLEDELKTDAYSRRKHHHVHQEGRYDHKSFD